ncbi:RING/FYVE/PHD zinc finger superfamily protein, partial [Striga asiatica]
MHRQVRLPGTICLQCGDKGFRNAFVYCVKCLKLALHRYCLDEIPETFDEFVHWVCDDCELEAQLNLTPLNNRDVGPNSTGDHIVPESVKGNCVVPENVNLLSDINEEEENDLSAVRKEEHDHKNEPAKSNNALEDKKGNDKVRRQSRWLLKVASESTIKSTRRSTRLIKSTKENDKRCSREKKRKRDSKLPSKEEGEKGSEKIVKKRRTSSGNSKTKTTIPSDYGLWANRISDFLSGVDIFRSVTICLHCGDRGFRNAFVYCVKCVKLALHRYCLDVIPETFDEFVYWVCDDCELEAQLKLTPLNNHDAGPTPSGDHIVAEEENVNLLSDINEEEEIDLSAVREEEHDQKDEPAKSNNALEGKKRNDKVRRQKRRLRKKASGSTIKSTRRSTRTIKSTKENNKSSLVNNASSRKKEKNKERIKAFAGSEKNKKTLGNNNASSCKKENKERAKACKAKGNKGPEQGERNRAFVRSSREKKRKRDSKLPSKREEDEMGSEKIVKKRRISSGKSKTKKTKATIPSEKIHDEEKLETCSEKPLVANIPPKDGEKGNFIFSNGDKNNLCEDSPKDFPIMSAEPVAMPIW